MKIIALTNVANHTKKRNLFNFSTTNIGLGYCKTTHDP